MKKTRSPQEKKALSLQKDRRNVFGENDKASRKNIPRSKAQAHRRSRRSAHEAERALASLPEDQAESLQLTLVTHRVQKPAFRKAPDKPLGEVIGKRRSQGTPPGETETG